MAFPEALTMAIYAISVVGCALAVYITMKIYSKEGAR